MISLLFSDRNIKSAEMLQPVSFSYMWASFCLPLEPKGFCSQFVRMLTSGVDPWLENGVCDGERRHG